MTGTNDDWLPNSPGLDQVRASFADPEDVDLPEDLRDRIGADAGADRGYDAPPPPEDGDEDPPERRACAFPLNDYGNGQRFQTYFGEDVIWVPRVGWFTWEGNVWRKDPDRIATRRLAQQVSGKMEKELFFIQLEDWKMTEIGKERELRESLRIAQEEGDDDAEARSTIYKLEAQIAAIASMKKTLSGMRQEHRRYAKSTGNTGKIDAMLTEGGIALAHDLETMDAEALAINTESGVLRFTVVKDPDSGMSPVVDYALHPHQRDDLMTKIMPVRWDTKAQCPQFDAFFNEVQPDPEMQAFILRWLGLCMTAVPVQQLAFWYGAGANGKSVLADLVARMMEGYSATAKIKSLTGVDRRGGGDATPDLMMLIGARFVRASEPKEGEPLQEDLIKELTGGEPIMVRALHSDFVEFRPIFKLTISGNHKPVIRGTDDGIWRRMLLVPWNVQIPEGRRDKGLGDRLFEQERDGIFGRLVEGLVDYLENGLQVPDQVSDATREFREESDPVGTFLDQCCVISGDHLDTIGARELADAFNYWLSESGMGEFKPRTVAIKLKDKAGRWKSRTTGKTFVSRKASTMAYDGIRFTDLFGQTFRNLPRDHQGRILRGRVASGEADE